MSNTVLTADIIAKESVAILENACVMGGLVYRGYEDDFNMQPNGYEVGSTVRIRRPTDFTVRTTSTATAQDIVEGQFNITVDQVRGVDIALTSNDLTLKIGDLSERVFRPAMIQLANEIDRTVHALYKDVWNWVGTPGLNVDSFSDFAKAPERLDLSGVPMDGRVAVLSPTDEYAMLGSQTALYMQDVAKGAYRSGDLGRIANIDTYSSQNVQTHTTGSRTQTAVGSTTASTDWASTKNTGTMTFGVTGLAATVTVLQGDVFTLASVFAVNPVTKATLSYLQPFVVRASATSAASSATVVTLTISPPIITSGAFQTVSAAPASGATVTFVGATASTGYSQNLVFRKNAFSLVMVPLVKPPGAVDVGRRSYKGYSVRVIPYYDGTNDISNYRIDVLFGVKTVDARQAVRLSGT